MTNISLFFLQKCLPGQFYFHQTKCGWFQVIYGECGREWLKILNAGESRKMRVSPAKCGWLGMYDMLLDPAVSPTTLLCITSRFAYMKHLFCWQLLLVFLYLTSTWMFFFHALATALPTSYRKKTVCFCWVWKLSNDGCPFNLIPSASFLTHSDWLEQKADQLLCLRKEALGMRVTPTKTMVRS